MPENAFIHRLGPNNTEPLHRSILFLLPPALFSPLLSSPLLTSRLSPLLGLQGGTAKSDTRAHCVDAQAPCFHLVPSWERSNAATRAATSTHADSPFGNGFQGLGRRCPKIPGDRFDASTCYPYTRSHTHSHTHTRSLHLTHILASCLCPGVIFSFRCAPVKSTTTIGPR